MNNSLSRNLFLTLFLVGLANIFLAYWFFYSSSVSLLKERGAEQMVSVRTLASQKLSLYLDVLKTHVQGPEVIAIYEEAGSGNYRVLAGNNKFLNPEVFSSMKANQLYPAGTDELMMKVEKENKKRVLIFAGVKLSELIGPEEGLGKTGEIYIVGLNDRIRSTSRHIQNRKPIIVKNDSVKFGRAGKTGVHEIKDYRGVEVLSAYSPFHYDHLNFVVLGEIDKEEVLRPLENLFPRILLICGFLCCLTLGLAIFSTREIMRLIDDMREKINKFHIRLINTMEEEKKRMSYNLHDGVGQILTAIKWGVAQEESPGKLKELCDDAFKEIRSVSDNLMPAVLTEFGFFSAIREYLSKQEGFYKIQTTYRYSDQLEKVSFREGMDVNLYRLIQELIHNTIKHSKARSISLVLLRENENFFLRYEDDGIGMPDADPMPKVILYRSELMGAIFKRTKLAEGLVYEISVPLKRLFHEL